MASTNRVVLITGAARGMGLAHSIELAKRGWHVCIADIIATDEAVAAVKRAGGSASSHYLDVADSTSWSALKDEIAADYKALHGLVNNAGVSYRYGINQTDDESWNRVMAINLTGVFYGMRAMSGLIKDSGGGSIVNISSIAGQLGYHGAAYGASKWGVRGLTKSAAAEYSPWNIRVNSVHPGLIETPMVSGATEFVETSLKSIPQSRAGQPNEVSAAVAFLISDESSYINGTELTVDGGLVASGTYWQIKNATEEKISRSSNE